MMAVKNFSLEEKQLKQQQQLNHQFFSESNLFNFHAVSNNFGNETAEW